MRFSGRTPHHASDQPARHRRDDRDVAPQLARRLWALVPAALFLLVAPLEAQFDTRVRTSLTGGLSGLEPYEFYRGEVKLRQSASVDYFMLPLSYTETLVRPLEAWLRLDLTRNRNSFLALRGRSGMAATESRVRDAGLRQPSRLIRYPEQPGRASWWAVDIMAGHRPHPLPEEIRLFGGFTLAGERLDGGAQRDTAGAMVYLRQDSLVSALLPWHERKMRSYGAFYGAEVRLQTAGRWSLTLTAEQRYRRVSVDPLEEAHRADFAADGRESVTATYNPFSTTPIAISLAAELKLGTWRRRDPRPLVTAMIPPDTAAEAATDWRDALPDTIRHTLAAGDTLTAIQLLEEERRRQPRNPLITGTLGMLLAERASELEADMADRQRAGRLLEAALRLDQGNPRYLAAYSLLLLNRLMIEEARRTLVRALDAAHHRPGEIRPQELALTFYTVGKSFEVRVLEHEDLRYDVTRPPSGQRPPGDFFVSYPNNPVVADSMRAEMLAAYQQALEFEPTHDGAHRGIMAAWARRALSGGPASRIAAGWWNRALAQGQSYQSAKPEDPWPQIFIATANYWKGNHAVADSLFASALPGLDDAGRRMFQDLATVLPAVDEGPWAELDEAQQDSLRTAFWRQRNPLHLTDINERLLEHMARVATAELLFGEPDTGLRGWQTDRGQVLIRYGLPQEIWQESTGGRISIGLTPPRHGQTVADRVIYWSYGIGLPTFVFYKNLNRFAVRHRDPAGLERLFQDRPEFFEPPFADLGPIAHQAARFRGAEPGQHEIAIFAQLPMGLLHIDPAEAALRGVSLHAGEDHLEVARQTDSTAVGDGFMEYRLVVPPGSYTYALEVLAPDGRTAASRKPLEVPPAGPELAISDLLITGADTEPQATPDPESIWELRSSPLHCVGVPSDGVTGIAFEIYGLTARDGVARYRVSLGAIAPAVTSRTRFLDRTRGQLEETSQSGLVFYREAGMEPERDRVVEWFETTLPTDPPDTNIRLDITITDMVTGQTASASRSLGTSACR